MNSKEFDEFVKRQQEKDPVAAQINWVQERDEWLDRLNELYDKVQQLLQKYISSGEIEFQFQSVQLEEEYIGTYHAKQMNLKIGRQQVKLVPIGTVIIGAKGRVDVIGRSGRNQILLVDRRIHDPRSLIKVSASMGTRPPATPSRPDEKIDWEWKILTRPPERKFIELTQENLFELLIEVANA